jgi:transposase-like protein
MKMINSTQKARILDESYKNGGSVATLAKKHGISEGTIHRWREKNKKQENMGDFIEVTIKEEKVEREKVKLKKAELIYEKFRIEIEGEISSAKIAPIMQILEENDKY